MVKIPILPDVYIKAPLRPGSVFYFPDAELSSPEPHYFIVLNINPFTDDILLLVCSSSQCEAVKWRRRECPETVVDISPSEYVRFTKDSVVDCNNPFPRTVAELVRKYEDGLLKPMPTMPMEIVQKLRTAMINSVLVAEELKDMIREE